MTTPTPNAIGLAREVKDWSRVDELADALGGFATISAKHLADAGHPTPRPAMVNPSLIRPRKPHMQDRPVEEWPEADRLLVEAMKRAVDKAGGQWPFPPVFLEWRGEKRVPWAASLPAALWVQDGHHRSGTAKALGIAEIPAFVQLPESEPDPPADVLAGVRALTGDDAEAFMIRYVDGYQPPVTAETQAAAGAAEDRR